MLKLSVLAERILMINKKKLYFYDICITSSMNVFYICRYRTCSTTTQGRWFQLILKGSFQPSNLRQGAALVIIANKLTVNGLVLSTIQLEQIWYKKDTICSKSKLILKLPRFFSHRIDGWKRAAISNLICFLTKCSRSYTVLALNIGTQ